MAWLQLETNLGNRDPATIEALLEELGAVAISLKDAGNHPLLEPAPGETPIWPTVMLTALFPDNVPEITIVNALTNQLSPEMLQFDRIEDQDWQANFKLKLEPRCFGKRLWITPNEKHTLPAGSRALILLPGLAFGSGEHPTTAMCLTWLDSLNLADTQVLDYGCGSGILGLAAAMLGSRSVCLTDIDPQALTAASDNAARNGLVGQVCIAPPDEIEDSVRYNVLVANILSGTLIELGPAVDRLMCPGARMALSGILADQAEQVCSAWSGWANMAVTDQVNEWVLLTGNKYGADTESVGLEMEN